MNRAFYILLAGVFILQATAFASDPIKSCSATIISLDDEPKKVPSKFEIFKVGENLEAVVTQTVEGYTDTEKDVAEISSYEVRAGLTSESDPDSLNEGESYIVHAMAVSELPEFEKRYSAGFDLRAVRSVKAYKIGAETRFGATTIVEAKDQAGKDLGSFISGIVIAPCK